MTEPRTRRSAATIVAYLLPVVLAAIVLGGFLGDVKFQVTGPIVLGAALIGFLVIALLRPKNSR